MARGRSMNQQDLPLEKPKRVRLSDETRAGKSHRLAVVGQAIRGHRRDLTAKTRDTRDAIKVLEAERAEIEDALIADEELKAQGELFVGGEPSKPEAQEVLASVAAVAGEVKPSEPHAFEPVSRGGLAGTMCKHCGSGRPDPVHGTEGLVPVDAELPSTVACSRCSKPVPKGEVLYDREVLPVCVTCQRAAINLGTWPHAFHAKSPKSTRCADCPLPQDDAVHVQITEETSTPGEVGPAESVAVAKARVVGNGNGRGKGAVHARP